MVEQSPSKDFVIKAEQKKFDSADDVIAALGGAQNFDLSTCESLTLGGNSYGFAACEWLSKQFEA